MVCCEVAVSRVQGGHRVNNDLLPSLSSLPCPHTPQQQTTRRRATPPAVSLAPWPLIAVGRAPAPFRIGRWIRADPRLMHGAPAAISAGTRTRPAQSDTERHGADKHLRAHGTFPRVHETTPPVPASFPRRHFGGIVTAKLVVCLGICGLSV